MLLSRNPDDLDLARQVATIFEIAEPRILVTLLQLSEHKSIVNMLWDVIIKSDDRRKRIIAG